MTPPDPVRAITARLSSAIAENGESLDTAAKALQGPLASAVHETGPLGQQLKDFLHGVWLGHSLHPALTDIPLGAWTAGVVFDLIGFEEAADASLALGSLAAIPAALAGTADWLEITDEQRRIGFVHGMLNAAALGLVVVSLGARARGRRGLGILLSTLGSSLAAVSGWLGGELVYVLGTGVSRNAFEPPASEFQVVADAAEFRDGVLSPGRIRLDNQDVPLVLLRRGDLILAVGGTCSHSGGPLAEGKLVADDCVECPWHHSRFNLHDGRVQQGPATVPQRAFEARIRDGKIEVRQKQTP
ncbi:MAG TPA: DUF2231 domain-containing protein [Chloroflexota bacterium]|nr:DUF2231 domain-containing protein [Chloroflexota bacterium]